MTQRPFIVAAFALAASAAPVFAQQSANASAPLQATVGNVLSMTSSGTTNFGTFGNTAHTETINPVSPTGGKTAALFTVSAEANRTMSFTCQGSATLTNSAGATMNFSPTFATSNSPQGSLQTLMGGCPGFTLSTPSGTLIIALGGNLIVGANQQAGVYNGTFVLNVTY